MTQKKDSEKFKLGRGAKQGDNISSKLFVSCLQYAIINKINWGKKMSGLTVSTYPTLFFPMIYSS